MSRDTVQSQKLSRSRVKEMSRHEGVSCDVCLKSNFKGRRYKCLRCFDYDLCASCFDSGTLTARHLADHPLQCILSRTDHELYYGGESPSDVNHSLTCPVCGRLGFTEAELQTHVTSEHQNSNIEVVCPICASMQGGEPNLVTEDLASHLTLEHRQPARGEDPGSGRQNLRRVQQSSSRTLGVGRARRPNMHFSSGGLSPSGGGSRDPVDPIAELLSQLSGVRRAVPYDRLVHTRHHGSGAGGSQQPAGLPTLPGSSSTGSRRSVFPPAPSQALVTDSTSGGLPQQQAQQETSGSKNERNLFLLDKCLDSQRRKELREDQSLFLQDLLLATMSLRDEESPGKSSPDFPSSP